MIKLKTGVRTSDLRPRARGSRTRKKKSGLKFQRYFSHEGSSPFDEIEWERRTAEITDDGGKVIFKQENVEVPKSWSALATKIAVSKYFYGDIANGTDPHAGGRETSVRQLIHRVTRTIADWGVKDGYFSDQTSVEAFYDDLTWLCLNQYGAFNSPVWFNVGLYHQYGIGKESGKGIVSTTAKREKPSARRRSMNIRRAAPASSKSVDDNMEDIMRLAHSEAMLFKYGSGTGIGSVDLPLVPRKAQRRRTSQRPAVVPEGL